MPQTHVSGTLIYKIYLPELIYYSNVRSFVSKKLGIDIFLEIDYLTSVKLTFHSENFSGIDEVLDFPQRALNYFKSLRV